MAIETMILLNIDFRIPRVRPHVEEKRSVPSGLTRVLALLGLGEYDMFLVALCDRPFVNCETFRDCDQYASCNYREQRK